VESDNGPILEAQTLMTSAIAAAGILTQVAVPSTSGGEAIVQQETPVTGGYSRESCATRHAPHSTRHTSRQTPHADHKPHATRRSQATHHTPRADHKPHATRGSNATRHTRITSHTPQLTSHRRTQIASHRRTPCRHNNTCREAVRGQGSLETTITSGCETLFCHSGITVFCHSSFTTFGQMGFT
jgi:hypothetical protein